MDRLTLRIENRSDAAGDMPDDISVLGQGLSIGRKASNELALPDTTRFISGKHASISYEDGSYLLEDVSTNGTFVNGSTKRFDGKHKLENGDSIRVGSFIVAVTVEPEVEAARPQIKGAQGVQAPPMAGTMRPPTGGIQRHNAASTSARGAQTPDFARFQTGVSGAAGVQRPHGGVSQPPVLRPPGAPAAVEIPDDFDDDFLDLLSPSADSAGEDDLVAPEADTPVVAPAPEPLVEAEPAEAPAPEPVAAPEQNPETDEPESAPAPPAAPLPDPTLDAPDADPVTPARTVEADPFVPEPPVVQSTPTPFDPFGSESAAPAAQTNAQPSAQEAAEAEPAQTRSDPFAPQPEPVQKPKPMQPVAEDIGPFSAFDPTAAPMVIRDPVPDGAAKPAMVNEKTDLTPRGFGERFAETTPPRANPIRPAESGVPTPAAAPEKPAQPAAAASVAEPATPTPAPAAVAATNELLEGFIEGAGIDDPDTLTFSMRELGVMLGRCARLGTQEMMQMLQDRSAVKLFVAQEDRTMRIASGNNPMKFMLDPNEAFKAMFVQQRDGYQTGPDGFDNALADIRQHQAAMMAAIQPALADMLEGLAPSEIATDVGGGRLGGGARKGWEEYNKRWDARAAQGENGMLDAFLDAFSRRYNQALDSL
jgi:type VI secretion system protein ImpI